MRYYGEAGPGTRGKIVAGFLGIDLTSVEAKPSACVAGFNHHLCDAAIAAYTAYLHYRGKTELCGEPEEGAICLPFLDRVAYSA